MKKTNVNRTHQDVAEVATKPPNALSKKHRVAVTNNGQWLKIGELARRSQVSLRTLRYYEELGLLAPATHSQGGHRLYRAEDAKRLQVINYLKQLPLSLEEIREVFQAKHNHGDKRSQVQMLMQVLNTKLESVEKKIDEFSAIREELQATLDILRVCEVCEEKQFLKAVICNSCDNIAGRCRLPLMLSVFIENEAKH